jgi:multidrug resistance efflux pump
VPVTVGEQVKSGQTLATLVVTGLQSKLDSAKSTLATAQAKLVSDQAAQASGSTVLATNTSTTLGGADTGQATPLVTASPSPSGSRGSGQTGGTGGTSGSTSSAEAAVTQAQNALLAAQKQLDADTTAIVNALHYCAPLLQSLPTGGSGPTQSPTPTPTTGGGGSQQGPGTTQCTSLLSGLPSQQQLAGDQGAVSNDEAALTTAVSNLAAQAKSGSGSTGGSGGSGSSGSGGSGSGGSSNSVSGSSRSSSGSGGGGTAVTAEQLVLDQANVDADAANAIVAAEAVNQATLISPLAGTVAAISVSPGSTASTSSAAVTVIGPGADQVATTVTDLDLKDVHIGSDASVTPDGSTTPVHGTITAIGLLPVSSSSSSSSSSSRSGASSSSSSSSSSTSSSATYPVTISLDTGGLYSGSGADVSIVVKKLSNVLAVPTSALTSLGTLHAVTLQSGGKGVRRVVQVGASDAIYTQITSGLTSGQKVALAQLNLGVPSSGSNTNLARLAGGGGVGRGAFTRSGAGGTGGTGRTGTTGATRTGG